MVNKPCDSGNANVIVKLVMDELQAFYQANTHIKESHGLKHAMAVYRHAVRALESCDALPQDTCMEILIAALLHDVDDKKYFPARNRDKYHNAKQILAKAKVSSQESRDQILSMIAMVSCSENGNSISPDIVESGQYILLIPRWCDRLEATGAAGVVRCFQYTMEQGQPLCTDASPRPKSEQELWEIATPARFEEYQKRGGTSTDMISHCYDKLLHIACPPTGIVRNRYLESMAKESSKEMVELCMRFGRTGLVDEDYIKQLSRSLQVDER